MFAALDPDDVHPQIVDNPQALEVWRRLAPRLSAAGVLTILDVDMFAMFCMAVANSQAARRLVDGAGVLVVGDKGRVVRSPALQVWRDNVAIARALASDFGLDPKSRQDLGLGGSPGGDDAGALDEFFDR